MKRFVFDLILFILIFICPWWVGAFFLFIGLFVFYNFYEFIIFSVIIYSLYSVNSDSFLSSPLFFSLIITLSYFVIESIKNNLILYKK